MIENRFGEDPIRSWRSCFCKMETVDSIDRKLKVYMNLEKLRKINKPVYAWITFERQSYVQKALENNCIFIPQKAQKDVKGEEAKIEKGDPDELIIHEDIILET